MLCIGIKKSVVFVFFDTPIALLRGSSLISKQPGLGVFARKLKARRGAAIAIKATARKLAEHYYQIFAKGMVYVEKGVELYEQKLKEQQLRFLTKKAAELNMQLVHN